MFVLYKYVIVFVSMYNSLKEGCVISRGSRRGFVRIHRKLRDALQRIFLCLYLYLYKYVLVFVQICICICKYSFVFVTDDWTARQVCVGIHRNLRGTLYFTHLYLYVFVFICQMHMYVFGFVFPCIFVCIWLKQGEVAWVFRESIQVPSGWSLFS